MRKGMVGSGAAATAVALAFGIFLAPTAAADPPTPFTPDWVGTWHSGAAGGPATVHLDSVDPISGDINIPGKCTAHWNERDRISATNRTVDAHVTSGPCGGNTWNVTILPTTSLIRVDYAHPGTTFSFTPGSSADF
jgi:hypothetical protein